MRMMGSLSDPEITVNAPTRWQKSKQHSKPKMKNTAEQLGDGVDSLTIEILKADLETCLDVLHYFLHEVWEQEQRPVDWRLGLIAKLNS